MSSRKHIAGGEDGRRDGDQSTRSAKIRNHGTGEPVLKDRELDALRRLRDAPKLPKVKVSRRGDRTRLEPDHPFEPVGIALLSESLGTTDQDFSNGILRELAAFTSVDGEMDEKELNFMLSIIGGFKPQDQIETLLGAHIAAVHILAMRFAARVVDTMSVPDRAASQQAFDKSTRTLVTLFEALRRRRSGGEQRVIVQHVNVGEGGQAIVGHVTHTQREVGSKNTAQTERPLLDGAKPVSMPPIRESRRRIGVTARRRVRQ
jgi:hypothetical protein